jgi:hypothetical protein
MLLLRQMSTLVDLMIKIQNYLVMMVDMIWCAQIIERLTKIVVLHVMNLWLKLLHLGNVKMMLELNTVLLFKNLQMFVLCNMNQFVAQIQKLIEIAV